MFVILSTWLGTSLYISSSTKKKSYEDSLAARKESSRFIWQKYDLEINKIEKELAGNSKELLERISGIIKRISDLDSGEFELRLIDRLKKMDEFIVSTASNSSNR